VVDRGPVRTGFSEKAIRNDGFFLFSEVRVSGSIPIVIGAEGGAKKPSEMMAFFTSILLWLNAI
jgi:hypothetical protein